MHLEIITPELSIFKGEAEAVQFPSIDGSFQVLNNHSPIISALKEGKIKVNLSENFEANEDLTEFVELDKADKKTIHVRIKGGVMEMLNNKVTVLAE